jgi:hypothetical protein
MNRRLTLISGFPGCGKSTFAEWLSDHKQFFHAEMERGGIDKEGLRPAWNDFASGIHRDSFVEQVFARSPRVVIDWNFPANEISLDIVAALRRRGCEIWWFEGYRLAARQRFLERGTEPVSDFDSHVGNICTAWKKIETLVEGNIIRSINQDATFLSPEDIWRRFSGSLADGVSD